MPGYAKFLKEIISKKRKLQDHETVMLTEECSAIIQKKLPPKLKDPGSFTIPCTIGECYFNKALCDLGASINLMPLSVFKKLGLGEAKATTVTLQLADRSFAHPRGIIEDVLVKVDKFIFPADFLILEMLIYEFMSNGTLRDHLSGKSKLPLSFAMRVRIALGSAKGILYLHTEANPPIFHRDIKSTNILLDPKFVAKVADFGLSRLAPVPELEGGMPSYVSTVVKGTPGYLDPEYFLTHKLTDKSDVYSLGVVFLELLTGMHPISHGKNIVREVNIAYRSSIIFSVIDEEMGSYPSECVEKFIDLALKCCQDETDSRPSMAEVVRELENIWLMTPESDTKISESKVTDPGKDITPPSSSTSLKHPYVSLDISSSDLVSGVIPTVTPR